MRKYKLLGAAALICVLAAGGSAFTASNTMPSGIVKGYGTQAITGVTATSVVYNLNPTEDQVLSVTVTLVGDTTADFIRVAFNTDPTALCSGAGTFTTSTVYTCAFDTGGLVGPIGYDLASINQFVLVADSIS
jgi:hypothetical protein